MFNTLFLDLDDVLVDFEGSILKLFGFSDPIPIGLKRKGLWSVDHWGIPGLDSESLLQTVDEIGISFWEELDKHPWFDELVNWAIGTAKEVKILTCPSEFKYSFEGKMNWFAKQELDKLGIELIVNSYKSAYASAGNLLIDDREVHCNNFFLRGGDAIVFPSFGNQLYKTRARFLNQELSVMEWLNNGVSSLECQRSFQNYR